MEKRVLEGGRNEPKLPHPAPVVGEQRYSNLTGSLRPDMHSSPAYQPLGLTTFAWLRASSGEPVVPYGIAPVACFD